MNNFKIDDLQLQLKSLAKCEKEIMECGLIYPAIEHVLIAQKEIIEAMKNELLIEYGLDSEIEKIIKLADKKYDWNWLEDFKEWRKTKRGK